MNETSPPAGGSRKTSGRRHANLSKTSGVQGELVAPRAARAKVPAHAKALIEVDASGKVTRAIIRGCTVPEAAAFRRRLHRDPDMKELCRLALLLCDRHSA